MHEEQNFCAQNLPQLCINRWSCPCALSDGCSSLWASFEAAYHVDLVLGKRLQIQQFVRT